jgi:hypothetical protein
VLTRNAKRGDYHASMTRSHEVLELARSLISLLLSVFDQPTRPPAQRDSKQEPHKQHAPPSALRIRRSANCFSMTQPRGCLKR